MGTIEAITTLTYIFFIVLLLATFVERFLEIAMAIFNYFEWRISMDRYWNRLAQSYTQRLERLYSIQGPSATSFQRSLDWILWRTVTEPAYPGGRRTVSAQLIRLTIVRGAARLVGFAISLLLVVTLKIDLIQYLMELFQTSIPHIPLFHSILELKGLHYLLTAVGIAIGTEPLHHLIVRVEKIKQKSTTTSRG